MPPNSKRRVGHKRAFLPILNHTYSQSFLLLRALSQAWHTDTRRTRYLTFDEEASLFEKLEGHEWLQRIVTMAINTGMRQGEIFDLTWFDVDMLRGLLHVRVSKNGKDRFVPINRMALRYTHATDESKRRAVENLVKPIGPSDESVTNEKGRVAALP